MNTTKHMNGGGRKWQCYQYCYIREDYEEPLSEKLSFKQIEDEFLQNHPKQKAFFAQYITAFDVAEPTKWWFTIKDDEYDLSKLNSHDRRNVISYKKKCYAKIIKPSDYAEALFDCYKKSFLAYPEKYRPTHFNFESFVIDLRKWNEAEYRLYAVFTNEENLLIGFALVTLKDRFVKMTMQKTNPEYENYRSNAALVDCMLNDWNEKLKTGEVIITNGSRSIKHETNFNAYLEKYFGFRKAYAKLRVVYRFPFGIIVKSLKPFKKLLEKSKRPFLYNIYCVLKLDSYAGR